MRAAAWAALALLAGACPEPKRPPMGLRVPLPDGWAARPSASGILEVGPKDRVVLTLERKEGRLPAVDVLSEAVESEGGVITASQADAGEVRLRYAKGQGAGFLVVRWLEGASLLLCASVPGTAEGELDAAETVCNDVRLAPR